MDTYRRIVEINIFGLLQALKKSAPLVRKGKGRIVTGTYLLVLLLMLKQGPS